jgi:hypothetical protein
VSNESLSSYPYVPVAEKANGDCESISMPPCSQMSARNCSDIAVPASHNMSIKCRLQMSATLIAMNFKSSILRSRKALLDESASLYRVVSRSNQMSRRARASEVQLTRNSLELE